MHLYTPRPRRFASAGALVADAATALPVLSAGRLAIRYARAGYALAADAATALTAGVAGGASRFAWRSQTITAAAPAVAWVVLQVTSALAPAHATCTSVSEVTFSRHTIKGHVADAHTVIIVVAAS